MVTEETKNKLYNVTEAMKEAFGDYLDVISEIISSPVVGAVDMMTAELKEPVEEAKTAKSKSTRSTAKKSSTKKSNPVEDEEDTETVSGHLDKEQLDGMKYNDLKKLAKDLGIPAKGGREELTEAILSAEVTADSTEEADEDEKPVRKSSAKKSKPVEDDVDDKDEDEDDNDTDDGEDDDDTDLDEITSTVEALVEDMDVEEIAEILADAGIKAKGRRQSLIDKLIQAVADGKITLSDEEYADDDDDEDDVDTDTDENAGEVDVNDIENDDMTDERKEALIALDKKIRRQIKDKKLKISTMKKALIDHYGEDSEDDIEELDKEDLIDAYIYVRQLFIDDNGEEVGFEEPYTVNGIDYCCGTPLQYDKKSNTYTCEVCDSEYGGSED